MELKDIIRKYCLQNAIKYDGRANPGNIIGKVIGEDPDLRNRGKELFKEIEKIVKEVNKLSIEQQIKELEKSAPELLEKKQEKPKELKELDGVDKKKGVIMRFSPSPSGPMHIGHAMTGGLTSLYVKKYGGKFILRIEDTNSDNICTPAYDLLKEDGDWIFGNISEVWIQSDRMEIYYNYILKFLKLGAAYVCTCSRDEFKDSCLSKCNCKCRSLSVDENLKRWEKMLSKTDGFREGEAVVRFKSDMGHKNPAMRDFPLARINDSEHPRQGLKYRVWPLMNLAVTVDDIEAGMTHIIRAKDHADNAIRQEMMYKVLGIKFPKTYFIGRIKFIGLEISCSKTKSRISCGEFSGWDDIRLPFLTALRRRGYQPGAFMKHALLNGISPVDKVWNCEEYFKSLNAFNKEIIDTIAKRFFFIEEPVEIEVKNAPSIEVELDIHPDNMKGGRKFRISTKFIIQKKDYERIKKGNLVRLMECLNFKIDGKNIVFVCRDYETFKEKGDFIIHWLPKDMKTITTEVLMPDNTLVKGVSEETLNIVKVGDVVQFERFGFCRLDEIKNDVYRFWYGHR